MCHASLELEISDFYHLKKFQTKFQIFALKYWRLHQNHNTTFNKICFLKVVEVMQMEAYISLILIKFEYTISSFLNTHAEKQKN